MKDYEALRNPKETMEFFIEDVFEVGYKQGYEDGQKEKLANAMIHDHEVAENKAYNRGLNDAWDAARKIAQTYAHFTCYDLNKIFGDRDSVGRKMIFEEYTPQDAIRKIKEYEDKQKQSPEIKVGDEVKTISDVRGVVITNKPDAKGDISVLFKTSSHVQLYPKDKLTRTGRTFPQIAEVLKEMRGGI